MSTKSRSRSRKALIAPVVTALMDVLAVVDWIDSLRADLAKATSAPNATRRAWGFKTFWASHAEAQKRLDAITAAGLSKRVAELRRQLDGLHYDATVAAFQLSQRRGGDVVSLAEARARRAATA